jgi:riboflavin biosynthesis pyrimidine reductase
MTAHEGGSTLSGQVLRLFPRPHGYFPLKGLYLDLDQLQNVPVVYGNFITSLDGRIALTDPNDGESQVPRELANPADWRLYQELAAQADVVITSARYFRQYARNRAQDVLPLGNGGDDADLRDWRDRHGLSAQPAVAILSKGLDIPREALAAYGDREIYVFTGGDADTRRVALLRDMGIQVILAGGSAVEGRRLISALANLGFEKIYAIAGPKVFHSLLAAGVVDYLFLTLGHQILGGDSFQTMVEGPRLESPRDLRLVSLYYDDQREDRSQFFTCFSFS